eukprot:TRINITY_DN94907_c0_g1_i1.p3 TRINITY_DN94907_c0_g1~~TRINITY_DN94907_c0_g1_i1.p3  ORF type:complete len:117 (+),score=21.27 TRINITY_DN94907_c0_g1_i1:54-404(+)
MHGPFLYQDTFCPKSCSIPWPRASGNLGTGSFRADKAMHVRFDSTGNDKADEDQKGTQGTKELEKENNRKNYRMVDSIRLAKNRGVPTNGGMQEEDQDGCCCGAGLQKLFGSAKER